MKWEQTTCVSTIVREMEKEKKKKKKCPPWDEQAKFFLCLTFSYVNKYINFWAKVERNCSRHFLVVAHTHSHATSAKDSCWFQRVFFFFVWFFVSSVAAIFFNVVSLDSSSCPSKLSSFVVRDVVRMYWELKN